MRTFKAPLARKFVAASSQHLSASGVPLTAVPLTMACWFNSDDVANQQTLMGIYASASTNQYTALVLRGDQAGDPISANSRSAAAGIIHGNSATGYVANRWHHACGVWASTTSRTPYLDGGGNATETTSVSPTTPNTTSIGRHADVSPDSYMSGMILLPTIWNIALSADEVMRLASGAHPLTVQPGAIVGYWDWDGSQTEFGIRAGINLTNSGSTPLTGPAFLAKRLPAMRRRFNSVAAVAGSRLLNLRRRACA